MAANKFKAVKPTKASKTATKIDAKPAGTWYDKNTDDVMIKLYGDMAITSDVLAGDRVKQLEFQKRFKAKSGLNVAPEEIVKRIINLRKRGKLPKLVVKG